MLLKAVERLQSQLSSDGNSSKNGLLRRRLAREVQKHRRCPARSFPATVSRSWRMHSGIEVRALAGSLGALAAGAGKVTL